MKIYIKYKIFKFKIIIILIFIYLLIKIFNYFKYKKKKKLIASKKKIKVCLCAVAKLENNYIREFILYYKKYKVDKIFLYDNNNIKEERFDSIISDFIKNKFVVLLNYRGKANKQIEIYNECYKKNYKKYDWLIFLDIDEYIYLKDFKNIKDFLNQTKFSKCQSIYLNWVMHTDNNLLYYQNKTLHKRFPKIYKKKITIGKSIIRGNIKGIKITSCHVLDRNIKNRCNGKGNKIILSFNSCDKPDNNDYYIDHYRFKSTQEFLGKLKKGDAIYGTFSNKTMYGRIHNYFLYNKITYKKIKFLEKKTGLNLSEYLIKINKNK